MRIPTWFVMVWVVGIGVLALAASLLTYGFVRDRAGELDEVLELPDPPQIGHPLSVPGADETTAIPSVMPAANPTAIPTAISTDISPVAGPSESAEDPSTPAADGSAEPPEVADAGETGNGVNDTAPEPWNDPRRVSVLLLGIDQREGESGPFLTDTIILFSLDPVGKTGAILSIPRDLWVEMPFVNARPARINTANRIGDEINYPGGGGPVYARRVVEQVLGLNQIDYYVLINFEVFTALIDALGPVEVCPTETIHDDDYPDGSYGYITVHFDPGCQELEAERLLQYARVRHTDSDIQRSSRQQEVILAVREKVLSLGGVLDLLPKAVTLWESAQKNIRTDMAFDDMVSLARKAEEIPPEDIRQGQITFAEVEIGETPDGDQYLIPIGTDIRLLIEDLFRPPGTPSRREAVSAE